MWPFAPYVTRKAGVGALRFFGKPLLILNSFFVSSRCDNGTRYEIHLRDWGELGAVAANNVHWKGHCAWHSVG